MQFNEEISVEEAFKYGYDCEKVPALIDGGCEECEESVCILPENYTIDDMYACLNAMGVVGEINHGLLCGPYGDPLKDTRLFETSWRKPGKMFGVCGFVNVPMDKLLMIVIKSKDE